MTAPDWRALRGEFPTLERWTYLDVARKTIPPRAQERALQEYWRDVVENAGADAAQVDRRVRDIRRDTDRRVARHATRFDGFTAAGGERQESDERDASARPKRVHVVPH